MSVAKAAAEGPTQGPPARIVPMRVIVCGVHRTGTLSMRSALWKLGFYNCYHMQTLIADPTRAHHWTRAIKAKYSPVISDATPFPFTRPDWDILLGDCQAVCDIPPAFFGADLARAYPDAKVIILNRDPEAWYDSVLHSTYEVTQPKSMWLVAKMVFCAIFNRDLRDLMQFTRTMNKLALGFDHGLEKEKALAWYERQYEEFRREIPEERRIEYSVKEGWGPLCKHLEVEVPMVADGEKAKMVEAPFPRLNDREFFKGRFEMMMKKSLGKGFSSFVDVVGKVTLAGGVGYAGYKALSVAGGVWRRGRW